MSQTGTAALLTLDRGNTTLDCRLVRGPVATRARLDPADPAALDGFLAGAEVALAVACCVVPGGLDPVREVLAAHSIPLRIAGEDLPAPLQIAYDDPREVGVDRWVAATAARARFGAALIVDCGTAVTLGVVAADGRFFPGPIAPGLATLGHGLGLRAPRLPPFDDRLPATWPPRGTRDAIRAGVGFGFVGLVEALAARLVAALRERGDLGGELGGEPGCELTRVATGGHAEHLCSVSASTWRHEPELIHDGLRWLATNHG